ncbi:host attachment family protein [Sphingomonas sp. Y38-1Y]|uniref:host attachment family protein n=1 Tax=Sphingomonas sp. Y38-1Y TaxID=3078265 RepID=UPI0028E2462D|nr:host attachment family protein [Sphingomonas sp. Y38-1Y]
MQVPHEAFVVVADGRKMLFFRNQGDAEHLNLVVERVREQDNPPDREQATSPSDQSQSSRSYGGAFASGGATSERVDFHQLAEDRFAAETAELLEKRALRGDFESLIVVAPPKTLGELRKHYHKEVEQRLTGELDKDLTGHPVPEIEKALANA